MVGLIAKSTYNQQQDNLRLRACGSNRPEPRSWGWDDCRRRHTFARSHFKQESRHKTHVGSGALHRLAKVARLAALWAGTSVVACTYDFDKFESAPNVSSSAGSSAWGNDGGISSSGGLTGSGGTSTSSGGLTGSGRTSTNGGMAGTGGASGTGGAVTVTGGSRASGGMQSTAGCSGVSYSGICWYLGAKGSSCTQVCANHGQPATNAASIVGTAAQGGSLTQCKTLFVLLGNTLAPVQGTRSDGLGLGCHLYGTVTWWLTSPNFDVASSQPISQRVCGCTE